MSRSLLLLALVLQAAPALAQEGPAPVLAKVDPAPSGKGPTLFGVMAPPRYAIPVFNFANAFDLRPEYRVVDDELLRPRLPLLFDEPWQAPAEWSSARAAAQRMLAKNAMLGSNSGVSKAAEAEEQRRVRALTASDLHKSGDAQNMLLTGDFAGAASLAVTVMSLNLNLGRSARSRAIDHDLIASDPELSFGLGLGRLGLKLRSEF